MFCLHALDFSFLIDLRGLKGLLQFCWALPLFQSFLLQGLLLLLCLSLLVVLSQIAILAKAVRVVGLVCVATGGSHLGFPSFVVAVMAHTFGIRLLVCVRAPSDFSRTSDGHFRSNGLNLIKTLERIGQDGVGLAAQEVFTQALGTWLGEVSL